ncbi:MAG TPA: hypothetical protein VGN81_07965 [Pseudonocardiaceae bacterium]|jgi:hypothetical protein
MSSSSQSNPSDEDRQRSRWQGVGRVVLNALIAYGVAACGYQPSAYDDSDVDEPVEESADVDWARMEAEFEEHRRERARQQNPDAHRREGKL